MKKVILFSILSIFMLVSFSFADFIITKDQLTQYGLKNYKKFYIAKISQHAKYIVGYELDNDIHKIAEGKKVIIWIFKLDKGKTKIANVKRIHVPLYQVEQIYPSTDEKQLLLMGNNGTKFIIMNLNNGRYYTLFKFKRGMPGFRGDKLAFSYKNNFYAYGYFYDSKRFVTKDRQLAKIDLTKKGLSAFNSVYDYEKVHHLFKDPVAAFKFISENQSIVVTKNIDKKYLTIYFLHNKYDYKKLDKAYYMSTAAGADNTVAYTVGYKDKEKGIKKLHYWVKLYNFKKNKTYDIVKDEKELYSYPFLSTDGKILLFAKLTGNGRMYLYYAKASEDFKKVHKLPTDNGNSYLGACKLSGDGKVYTHQVRGNIYVGLIK